MNNIYIDIFLEHLKTIFLVPLGNDVTLSTMRFMQPDELHIMPHLVALCAILTGATLNWWLGKFFSRYRSAFHGISEDDYQFFRGLMQKYGVWLVALWWMPVGTVLPFIAGFFGVRWWKVMILLVAGYDLQLLVE